jgi:peptidoglycan-associated lipoprotein
MPQFKLVFVGLLVFIFAGCSSPTIPDPEPTEQVSSTETTTDSYDDASMDEGEDVAYDPSAGELSHIIYFDFDSSELRPEDTDTVARHAMQLAQNAGSRVRLEGHADERGSREYNIGLGERRSQTVRRMLLIQGATASQISTVSFGEERPVADGSDEAAYAQNRRVEIKYTN